MSVIHAGLGLFLVIGAVRAWRSHPGVRRGQLVGLILAFGGVILVQVGTTSAFGPIPLPQLTDSARTSILRYFDLSDEATADMGVEDLWSVGRRCLLWPAEIPAGLDRQGVRERLREAKRSLPGESDPLYRGSRVQRPAD